MRFECEVAGRIAQAVVEVQTARTPAEPSHAATVTVLSAFEFEQGHYQLKWTQTKVLRLRAPTGTCEAGTLVSVTGNAPGITILRNSIPMELDPELGFMVGRVNIEAKVPGAEGTLTAALGALTAECRVSVLRDYNGPSLQFSIENKAAGKYRALWVERPDPVTGDSVRVLEIQGRHPALHPFLGDPPAFPGQNTSSVRLLLAEIVADNVCREIARRLDLLRMEDEHPDAEGFYAEHYTRLQKLLPKLQELMVKDGVGRESLTE